MRKLLLCIPLVCFSCARRIGDLTMIATRNIDSKTEYVELKRYAKAKGKTIEEAVDRTLREVPGGEFMKNVVIYSNGAVEGDVWGVAGIKTEKEKKREVADNKRAIAESKDEIQREKNRVIDSTNKANKSAERERMEELRKKVLEEKKVEFAVGDKVSWVNKLRKVVTGEIVGKDEEYAVIKMQEGQLVKIKYLILTKIQ